MKHDPDDYQDRCRLECDECSWVWEGPESEADDESLCHHAMSGHHPFETAPKGGQPGSRSGKGKERQPAGYIDPLYLDAAVDYGIELEPLSTPLPAEIQIPTIEDGFEDKQAQLNASKQQA